MATITEVKITSHKDEVIKAKDEAVEKALMEIGMDMERYAKLLAPVDTGRLRNSITYATKQYSGQGSYSDENGNSYDDATARGEPEKNSVYVGTNVEYAASQELGDFKHKVGQSPYLRPAVEDHIAEYRQTLEDNLKSE